MGYDLMRWYSAALRKEFTHPNARLVLVFGSI